MNVTSQLEAVTVYAAGAVCTRRAKVAAPPGPTRQQRVNGLPLSLRATSLRAKIVSGGGDLRVVDVRAGFDVALADEVDVPAEQKALEAAEAALAQLEQTLAREAREAHELASLRPAFPVPKKGAPPRPAPVDAMLQLAGFVDQQLGTRGPRLRALEQEVADARNEVQLKQRRLAEASSSRRTERAKLSRSAVVTFSADQTTALELQIEYQVPGARWAPSYALRLDQAMGGGALAMRASVAQATGEDWTQVQLSLSTAQLDRRTDLPELRSLKIGRSQPAPPKSGWREPPSGLEELFAGYDEAAARMPPLPPPTRAGGAAPPPKGGKKDAVAPEPAPASIGFAVPPPPPPPQAPMMPAGMPMPHEVSAPTRARMAMPPMQMMPAAKRGGGLLSAFGGAVGAAAGAVGGMVELARSADRNEMEQDEGYGGDAPSGESMVADGPAIVPQAGLLDYDRLTMPAPDAGGTRGQLQPASEWDFAFVTSVNVQVSVVTAVLARAVRVAGQVEQLPLPHHAAPVRASAAAFDYRYDCAAKLDVPSTGAWTLVPVVTAQVGLTPGYACVPAVEPKVYRVLKVANRSPHALLQGPVDVSIGDEFLMTTQLPTIAPKGEDARLGLGVEEALKVARKTEFKETTGGLLGGSTLLPHEVEIEVSNRLPHPAAVEIRERVPVTTDEDVKIEEVAVKPPWEKDEKVREGVQTDGARRWLITVPAGEKAKVTAQFHIKIPSDKMLVGGNRRV